MASALSYIYVNFKSFKRFVQIVSTTRTLQSTCGVAEFVNVLRLRSRGLAFLKICQVTGINLLAPLHVQINAALAVED